MLRPGLLARALPPLRAPARSLMKRTERTRLPMPALQATLDRYLATVEPLLSADEKEQTRRVVAEFGAGEGLELHAALEKLDATDVYLPDRRALRGSWIEHFWDDMYLEGRYPVVINSNPFLTFKPDPVAERRTQARRAANLVFASVTVSHMIDNYELDVGPECPSQYLQLFRTCRIPRFARDSLRTDVGTRHIVVMHRGRYYKLDVLSATGGPISEARIARALSAILDDTRAPPGPDLSSLTGLPRDEWASCYWSLRDHSTDNAHALDALESALFHLVLEDRQPGSKDELAALMLHGHGQSRWHDKSLSLVVLPSGEAGFSFEHSWGDGQTLLRWASAAAEHAQVKHAPFIPQPGVAAMEVEGQELALEVPDYVKQGYQRWRASVDDLVGSVDITGRVFRGCGKALFKESKVSPDAAMQVAMQRAQWAMFGEPGSTYESCSTKHFHHGRTETIRSVTHESIAFAKADAGAADAEQKLRAATAKHVEVAKACQQAQGVDRHLFALQAIARQRGQSPALFQDTAYRRLKNDKLSTSNCGADSLDMFGFGPTTPNCHGIGYMLYDDAISFTVSSFKNSAPKMADAIESALGDVKAILKRGSQ